VSQADVTTPRVLGPAQGLILGPPQATDRFMLGSTETSGRLAIVEHTIAPGVLAAPMHRHAHEDESASVAYQGGRDGQDGHRRDEPDDRGAQLRCQSVFGRVQDQVAGVGDVVAHEHGCLPPGDGVAGEKHRQRGDRDRDHHRDVEAQGSLADRDPVRRDEPTEPEHGQQVEDAAADHVAHRDVAFAPDGGQHRGRDLRQRGAGRDDGQADDQLADPECGRGGHRRLDQPSCAHHEQTQPDQHQRHVHHRPDPVDRHGECLVVLLDHRRGLPPALADQPHRVGDDAGEQHRPVDASDATIERQQQHDDRHPDQQRHVEPDQLLGDHKRCDQRGQPEDEQHVEDVAADHVAQRHLGLPRVGGADRHRHLRRRGPERDHRETDHQRRDPRRDRQPRRATHQQLRPTHQQCPTQHEQQHRMGHLDSSSATDHTCAPGMRIMPQTSHES
jgi:hypothetical protein